MRASVLRGKRGGESVAMIRPKKGQCVIVRGQGKGKIVFIRRIYNRTYYDVKMADGKTRTVTAAELIYAVK